jgi:hypothetical protein
MGLLILCGLAAHSACADETGTLTSALDAWKRDPAAIPDGCKSPSPEFPRLLSYETGSTSKATVDGKDCVICTVTCRFGKEPFSSCPTDGAARGSR